MRTDKVLDLVNSCNSKVIGVLFNPSLKRENQVLKKRKKYPKTGTTCRPSSIRNVDKANENPKTNRLKNRCKNCYFFILSADKKMGTTNPIYVLFRTKLARNGLPRRQYSERILRMAVHDRTCQLYGHGS